VFFLNSVRRRLVTGLTVALGLMLIIAAVGILGLIWHRQAVSELEYVLHESPDPGQLSRSYDRILVALNADLAGLSDRRAAYIDAVRAAQQELGTFMIRMEGIKHSAELQANRRPIIQRIIKMQRILSGLERSEWALNVAPQLEPAMKATHFAAFRDDYVVEEVLDLKDFVENLPAWQERETFSDSLRKEQKRSARLMKFVLGMTAAATAFYAIMIYCAFRWISNPISTISKGASRIAEGDPKFLVPEISGWNDEFSKLRSNVNLMAERFREAEKDLNAKVRERSQQLLRSERLAGLGFLAAGVAHEINNPVSAIRLAADSLEYRLIENLPEDAPDRTEIMDRLAMIRRESARCGEITARTLNFARGDQSTMASDCLTRVVEEVLEMVRPMPAYRDRANVFERSTSLYVTMNASQMKQVILNLVANALQATPSDGRVEVRLTQQVDWVVLEVEDNGCGMSSETMTHLFEPFYSTKQAGQGTGLGMSITHRIIENHDGTIEPVSSGEGQGSLFRVRLPMRQSQRVVA